MPSATRPPNYVSGRKPRADAPKPMCAHHRPVNLGYLDWHAWAKALAREGVRQQQCPDCRLWLFPEEMGVKPL